MLTPSQAHGLDKLLFDDGDAVDPEAVPMPERIGRWRTLSVIGVGGMGTVYAAQQEEPRRTVAIKVLRRGVASRSAMKRFRHEVEVLGALRHVGIAQIYEAGVHDDGLGGVPFFVMEYIANAMPITAHAVQYKLPVRTRLQLFIRACDAVHYGHLKGVQHRDLKPENILVGRDPSIDDEYVKVIDFGIARTTDADLAITTVETDARTLLGTLQYMSPEQCDVAPASEGRTETRYDIDIRSDVYSLGVVLYKLVTDHLPYDVSHKSLPTAVRIIQEAEPRPPSSFRRSLRGNLETIIRKAMAKDREARYDSAGELAKDLRRHLAGEPIDARPPSVWVKGVRWIGRHPLLATTAACIAIAAATTLSTFVAFKWYALRPHRIVISDDHREARVESIGGGTLKTWNSGFKGGIRFGEFVDRPEEQGGGRLVLVGFSTEAVSSNAGALVAYDVRKGFDEPEWAFSLTADEVIEPIGSALFGLHMGTMIADVFDDPPGDEIITVLLHCTSSWTAICVLDLRGKCLYRAWHHGSIADGYWMRGPRRYVAVASNNEALWKDRGYPAVERPRPLVVFGIDPVLQQSGNLIIEAAVEPWITDWYKCILPPAAADPFTISLLRPDPGEDLWSRVQLQFHLIRSDQNDATFSILLDEHGNQVPGGTRAGDSWSAHAGDDSGLIEVLGLGPLPPVASKVPGPEPDQP